MNPTKMRRLIQRYGNLGLLLAAVYLGARHLIRQRKVYWMPFVLLFPFLLGSYLGSHHFPARRTGELGRTPAHPAPSVVPETVSTLPAPRNPITTVCLPDCAYVFQWQSVHEEFDQYEGGIRGDRLRVYRKNAPTNAPPLFNHFFEAYEITSILPWSATSRGPYGFRVHIEPGLGSAAQYLYFADIGGHLKQVLDYFSDYDWSPPESVDLDADLVPEIVTVDNYSDLMHKPEVCLGGITAARLTNQWARQESRARVWKWSELKNEYVLVRVSSYADRLKPLHKHEQ